MQLTQENYHSPQANQNYLSVSLLKEFASCENKALAKMNGDYHEEPTNAMLVGSYLHSAFESEEEFEKFFRHNHKDILKKSVWNKKEEVNLLNFVYDTSKKLEPYRQADEMINTLKNDPFVMMMLEGEKEQIYTGELFGEPFKIKVDNVGDTFFSDIKTCRDLHTKYWNPKYEDKVNFAFHYGYVFQMWAYQEILRQNGLNLDPYIVAVTKETPPNKAVIEVSNQHFDFETEWGYQLIQQYRRVKGGQEPKRCENCVYCRHAKQITDVVEVGTI